MLYKIPKKIITPRDDSADPLSGSKKRKISDERKLSDDSNVDSAKRREEGPLRRLSDISGRDRGAGSRYSTDSYTNISYRRVSIPDSATLPPPPPRKALNIEPVLLPNWKATVSETGETYYYNTETRISSWEIPLLNPGSDTAQSSQSLSPVKRTDTVKDPPLMTASSITQSELDEIVNQANVNAEKRKAEEAAEKRKAEKQRELDEILPKKSSVKPEQRLKMLKKSVWARGLTR
jgi:hypothetical protein